MADALNGKSHEDYHDESHSRPIQVLVREIPHALTMNNVAEIAEAILSIRRRHADGVWEAQHFDGKHASHGGAPAGDER